MCLLAILHAPLLAGETPILCRVKARLTALTRNPPTCSTPRFLNLLQIFNGYQIPEMLWIGHVKHPSKYNCTSFYSTLAGVQGQTLFTFTRQTSIQNYTLENVSTFQLDNESPQASRKGWAVSANMTLKCQKTPHGPLTCSVSGKKYKKEILLHPSPNNCVTVVRFEKCGDIVTRPVNDSWNADWDDDIKLGIPIKMIPLTDLGHIPISYVNPKLPGPSSSRFNFTAENREVFPSCRDSTLSTVVHLDQDETPRSTNSSIQAGFVISTESGSIDIISKQTETRVAPPFAPVQTSTMETPPGRISGQLSVGLQTPTEDRASPGIGFRGRSPTMARSHKRSPRLFKLSSIGCQTGDGSKRRRTRSLSPNSESKVD